MFLDLKNAFDQVNHAKLFKKMLDRLVPIYIVKFIAYWYINQELSVKWGNAVSGTFQVSNGIRQGGIVVPISVQYLCG